MPPPAPHDVSVHLPRPRDGETLDDLRPALRTLARSACTLLTRADGAGITVVLAGGSLPVGSDDDIEAVETLQHRIGEGPVPTALRTRSRVRWHAPEPAQVRWPWFVERVRASGVRGGVSVPLLADDELLGALTIYHREPRYVDATREAELQGATRTALHTLLDLRLRALLVEALQCLADAQRERAEVDLAVGLLTDRYGYTPHQALVLVVQLARQDGVSPAVAARVLTGRDGSS